MYLKYHSSPDSHGLAATVSYIVENPSLNKIQNEFMEQTKSSIPVHLGQKTPIMESTWNILDSRLRFASDTILTVGRIGMPVYLSTFLTKNSIENFTFLLILFCIYVTWLICQNILEIIDSQKIKHKNIWEEGMIIFLILSPISLVWILEATLNQLCLLMSISSIMNLVLMKFNNKVNDKEFLFLNIILIIFSSVTYPQGLPILLIFYFLYNLVNFRKKHFRFFIINMSIPFLIGFLILTLTVKYSIFALIKNFLSGISGIPYQLGSLDIISSIFWIFGGVKFTKSTVSTNGFGEISNNYTNAATQIIIILLFTFFFIIRSNLSVYLKIINAFTLFTIFFILMNGINTARSGNSYIYVRYLVLFIIILVSINFHLLNQNAKVINFINRKKFIIIALIILIFQVYIGANKIQAFNNISTNFVLWEKDTNKTIFNENTLFVSDTPQHKLFSLTLLGKFNYLTDNWNPLIYIENQEKNYDIYYVKETNDIITFKFVDKYKFEKSEYGPITFDQIKEKLKNKNE